MSEDKLRELFPSSARLAIGGADTKGTNTVEQYQNALLRYGKQSFGMFGDIFKDLEIKDEYLRPYKPTEEQKAAAGVDRFLEKDLFNLIDSSKKIVDDFRMIRPKMTAFVLQSITPAGEEKIKERYRPEWTKAINEDDIIAMVKLIIICHSSTGKASEFTDKFIAVEEYRNFSYKEGTSIAEYASQLYLLDRKILQVGADHIPAREQVYIVIMKLKEHKNLAIRAKVMEYLSKMNKPDFPTSRDEVLESLIELETLSNLTLDGIKTSNKLPSVHSTSKEDTEKGPKIINFTDGSHGFERPDGLYEVFVIDAKGKFIKNKTVKGKKTKKGIAIFEDKRIADSAKTATEKHIEKLIKQKSISRDEAKRMFKCKFCQIDGHFEVDCRKKKAESKDKSSDKDKTSKDKDNRASKSVFFSKSSAPAAADSDSEDESYEPRAYVVAISQPDLSSSEGGSRVMPELDVDDDVPGLIDDSDSDDDIDVTVRHVRRRLPWRSPVDYLNGSLPGDDIHDSVTQAAAPVPDLSIGEAQVLSDDNHSQDLSSDSYTAHTGVYVARRTSTARGTTDNISGPSVFRSLQPLGTYATSTQSKRVEDNLSWVLDSMANVNVACNPDLVVHLRATEVAGLRGIGGTTKLEEIGTHPLWGDVFIDRSQPYNILSLHQAQEHGFRELTSQDQQRKILSNPDRGIALVFHKDDTDKFYKLHASKVVEYIRKVYAIGLQDVYCESRVYNAAHFYTLDQQQRAQEAIRLHQAFNHPSDKALSTLLVSPSAINIKITPMDLQNARAIYGPCPHCLEGKPQPSKGSHKSFDDALKPTQPGELLHCDIVFIKGKPRLFSVDHVSGYMMLVAMDSKKTEELVRAMDVTVTKYRSHHKVVHIISTDHESVLKSDQLALHLNGKGVKMALRIPYEHEKTAERSMRVVREKMEAKISELPYNLPSDLYDYLAQDVVHQCNHLPNIHTTPRTPHEIVTGSKFNFLTDLLCPFGVPILVVGGDVTKHQNPANAQGVCLGDAPDTKGGVLTLLPNDNRPVVRRGIRGMPYSKDWIAYMNEWADRKPLKPSDGPFVFKPTMEYSETGITGNDKEITRTFDASGTVVDLPDTATRAFIDIGLTSTVLPASDSLTSIGSISTVRTPPPSDPVVVTAPALPVLVPGRDSSPPVATPTLDHSKAISSPGSDGSTTTVRSVPVPATTSKQRHKPAVQPDPTPTRQSARIIERGYGYRKPDSIQFLTLCQAYLLQIETAQCPSYAAFATGSLTWHEAAKSNNAAEAKEAALKELRSLTNLQSWRYLRSISDRTPSVHDKITVPSLLLKPKYDAAGGFLLWKGRLVAGGHMTDPNIYDPYERHAPTVPLEVAKMQLGLASFTKASIEVFDIPTAYLNAQLEVDKRHLMKFPRYLAILLVQADPTAKDFMQQDGTILVEIVRALYGLPESAKRWNTHFTAVLTSGGYVQCDSEPCLFKKGDINGQQWSIVTIYVDDCLHVYKGAKMRIELYGTLAKAKLPAPTVQQLTAKLPISYLGMLIQLKGDYLTFSQPGYINDLLAKYPPDKKFKTPCTEDIFKPPLSDLATPLINITIFLSMLMQLMFLATRTRPDILTAVCALATKCKEPREADQVRLHRVIGYLAEYPTLELHCKVTDLQLHAYFDAGWACHSDMKGHSGMVLTLGHFGFPILCKSQKQKVVTRSSTEAELVCMYAGVDLALCYRRIGQFLGFPDKAPLPVYQDNTSSMKIATMGRGSSTSNTKFMDLKFQWLKQHIETKVIVLHYLTTNEMIADFFASPRIGETFRVMRRIIMGTYYVSTA